MLPGPDDRAVPHQHTVVERAPLWFKHRVATRFARRARVAAFVPLYRAITGLHNASLYLRTLGVVHRATPPHAAFLRGPRALYAAAPHTPRPWTLTATARRYTGACAAFAVHM